MPLYQAEIDKMLAEGIISPVTGQTDWVNSIVCNIKDVCGIADDIIVAGETPQEHDDAMLKMLEASRKNNISLNSEKLQFKQQKVDFYGHRLSGKGIQPSEDKLQAIKNIKTPTNPKELQQILGMMTYLNRFSTKLAKMTAPLRKLLKNGVHFRWDETHQAALDLIKKELCDAKILSYYNPDPEAKTILQCDASQLGLGAWLRQIDKDGTERIVAMCSRSLVDAETRYSNIERECLAVKFGLQKFEYYLLGRHTIIESDHSPLEQIFRNNIAETPSRLQKMILWCLGFDITVVYKPGTKIPVADALSRVCLPESAIEESRQCEVNFVTGIESPIDVHRIKDETHHDSTLNMLKDIVFRGWQNLRKQCPQELCDYWNFRCDLVIDDGLVLKGDRIVIPQSLKKEVLEAIHTGHQGETKCLLLARESVFWPGITNDVRDMVQKCEVCSRHQPAPSKLPIMQPDMPTGPWEKIGTDIFEYDNEKHLMIVDYFSRYFVVKKLPDMRAQTVCSKFTEVLTEFGMPTTIMADFGTQYTSEEFKKKCRSMNINITYSSPYHHQTNSVAERAIGTVKQLWRKSIEDGQSKETALWMYRITPLDDNLPSPYELLFNRKPRSFIPGCQRTTKSRHPENDQHIEQNQRRQEDQARFYNKKATHDRKPFQPGEPVNIYNTINKEWEPGTVVRQDQQEAEPRTYTVHKGNKEYRRTREHLKIRKHPVRAATNTSTSRAVTNQSPTVNQQEPSGESQDKNHQNLPTPHETPRKTAQRNPDQQRTQQPTSPGNATTVQTTRYGRTVKMPERLNYS